MASKVGYEAMYVQQGERRCNVFSDAPIAAGAIELGQDGNVEADPLFVAPDDFDFSLAEDSPARDAGCFGQGAVDLDGTVADIGASGGLLGAWYAKPIAPP